MSKKITESNLKHRRIVVTRHGEPEVLKMIEEDLPTPQAGEVRVKVVAAGISGYDLMFRRSGALPGTPRPPFTLGEDVVGLVDQLGPGTNSLEIGQLVAGGTFANGLGGGYAEHICLPAGELVPVPAGLDPAEAVCLVVNYLTAHMAMHRTARVRKGESMLVQGAAGGVGTALLDLGRQAGLEMYGTASKHNHQVVERLGGTPIDYRAGDFVKRIREHTRDGVDTVFDPVGGARQLWRSYRAARKGGRLVWFGVAATKQNGLRVIPLTLLALTALKVAPGAKRVLTTPDLSKENSWYRETLADLFELLAAGKIKPVVSERIPLDEAAYAHELMESGRYAGKLVLVTDVYSEYLASTIGRPTTSERGETQVLA